MKKPLICFIFASFAFASIVQADVPVRTEELIYSIIAFNGMHFSQSFSRESSDSIYVLADTNNFFLLRKTLVYYWPLTEQWLTDINRLDRSFDGILEVAKSGKTVKELQPEVFLYYNLPGEVQNDWRVFVGDAATVESEKLEAQEADFQKKMQEYGEKYRMYEQIKKAFIERMQERSEAGKDTGELLARFKQLVEPEAPSPPPYQELTGGKQFIVNLPKGEYSIRLRDSEGRILEGSEKTLVVFDKRRENGIGYDVVPSDKWTEPSKSVTPTNVIYVDGTVDLYVVPFIQKEFNDLYYNKMLLNSSKGNPSLFRWEKVAEVPRSRIERTAGSASEIILEKKYYVAPMQSGNILGYKIEPFDPIGAHRGKSFSFKGFHIPIDSTARSIVLKLQSTTGGYYPLSEREIRVVVRSGGWIVPALVIFLPLIVMSFALVRRRAASLMSGYLAWNIRAWEPGPEAERKKTRNRNRAPG